MTNDRPVIQVKAMLIVPNADHTAHAVSLNAPTTEDPGGYHRLIGGTVEVGESHRDAIRREVEERGQAYGYRLLRRTTEPPPPAIGRAMAATASPTISAQWVSSRVSAQPRASLATRIRPCTSLGAEANP